MSPMPVPVSIMVGGVRFSATMVETIMTVRQHHPELLDMMRVAARDTATALAMDLIAVAPDVLAQAQGRAQVAQAMCVLLADPEDYWTRLTTPRNRT